MYTESVYLYILHQNLQGFEEKTLSLSKLKPYKSCFEEKTMSLSKLKLKPYNSCFEEKTLSISKPKP